MIRCHQRGSDNTNARFGRHSFSHTRKATEWWHPCLRGCQHCEISARFLYNKQLISTEAPSPFHSIIFSLIPFFISIRRRSWNSIMFLILPILPCDANPEAGNFLNVFFIIEQLEPIVLIKLSQIENRVVRCRHQGERLKGTRYFVCTPLFARLKLSNYLGAIICAFV